MVKMGMDIRQFEYVTAIAHELSITRAAEKLHISAPTLSQFLSRLEGELGISLFFRNRLGVVPTEAGQAYLDGARAIQRTHGETLDRLNRLKENPGHVIRVGVTPGRSVALFTTFLPAFMARHPGVDVRMEESPMAQLDELLRAGKVDFALSVLHLSDSALSGEALHSDELVFVLSAHQPALGLLPSPLQGPLTPGHLAALAAEKFIVSKPGCRLRDAADYYFGAAGFAPRQLMESNQIDQVCQLVQRGVGVGFIPSGLAELHKDLVVFSLAPALRLEFGIQYLRGREPSGNGRTFVRELRAHLQVDQPPNSWSASEPPRQFW